MLTLLRYICGPLENNVYLWLDRETRDCAVVDPGIGCEEVQAVIEQLSLEVRLILNTHGHFDHIFSNAGFTARYPQARLALHPGDLPLLEHLPQTAAGWGFPGAAACPPPDILLQHGQQLELGAARIAVRHTPGHSPGQVAFISGEDAVVGDTLFYRGVGRWDLPGSDFHALERSILEQLYTLPDATQVWPGHGEPTTIGDERRLNPYIGDGARFKPKL
jgi:hydroxyacylglutathione hydrolase